MDSVIDHYIHYEIFEAHRELQEAGIYPVVRKKTSTTLPAPTEIDRIVAWSLRIAEMTDGIVCDGDALASNPEPFANIHVFVDIVAWLQRAEFRYRAIQKIFAQLVAQATIFLQENGLQQRSALTVLFSPKIRMVLWKHAKDLAEELSSKAVPHISSGLHQANFSDRTSSNDLLSRLLYVATELSLDPSDNLEEELKSWQTRPLQLPHFLTSLLFAEVRERKSALGLGGRASHVETHLAEPGSYRTRTALSKHTVQGDLTVSLSLKELKISKKRRRARNPSALLREERFAKAITPQGVILGRSTSGETP